MTDEHTHCFRRFVLIETPRWTGPEFWRHGFFDRVMWTNRPHPEAWYVGWRCPPPCGEMGYAA